MQVERLVVDSSPPPFPIYPDAAGELLRAHATSLDRDATVAHILAVLSGYAYGDTATVATMASRLGMAGSACVRIAETVDAMYIFSTAYLLQSRCGRVAILCYRGTELANLANWLGNADVGSHTMDVGGAPLCVHAGFHRNMRATRWPIVECLRAAVRGESIAGASTRMDHPLEALYITGHSLGGAMAVLFALSLTGEEALLGEKLRAVSLASADGVGAAPALRTRVPLRRWAVAEARSRDRAARGLGRRSLLPAGHVRAAEEARSAALHDGGPLASSLHRRASSGGKGDRVRRSRVRSDVPPRAHLRHARDVARRRVLVTAVGTLLVLDAGRRG